MAKRINRAIELLENDQPIYYAGLHSFSKDFLTYEQGKKDANIWADYINIGIAKIIDNMVTPIHNSSQ